MKEILDFRECIFLLDKLPSYYKNLNTDFSNDFNYKNDIINPDFFEIK